MTYQKNQPEKKNSKYYHYKSDFYSPDAFRIAITTKFSKTDLKKHHLHSNTVYRVLTVLAGYVTRKNNSIFNKSLDCIALNAGVCKESALKAVNFLKDTGHLRLEKGRGKYPNKYWHQYKESKVFHTKNGATLPFITLKDHVLMKKLNNAQGLSKTARSFLPYILLHAGNLNGFNASKKTILEYSGRDRRTLNKAYEELKEKGILKPWHLYGKIKLPSYKGQAGYIVDRERLNWFTVNPKSKPDIPIKKTA